MPSKSLPRKSSARKTFARYSSELRLRNRWLFAWLCSAILLSGTLAFAQGGKPQPHGKAASAAGIARGKYIVENVAICAQCHTPRDYDGNPDRAHWLQGSSVPFNPVKPDPSWPITAPRIGGTPLPAGDEDMAKLLTTGIWTNGEHLRPPMPQFRLSQEDAEAVVAYLKSLNAQQ